MGAPGSGCGRRKPLASRRLRRAEPAPPRPAPPRPAAPVDDPTGGRRLTARLIRGIPPALAAGLVIAVPLSIIAGEWRLAVIVPLAVAGITGGILAAIEDGRVQRRVDRERRRGR